MTKTIDSDCVIDTNLQVTGNLEVNENLLVRKNALIKTNLTVEGVLIVKGILTTTVHQQVTKYHYNYEAVPPTFLGRLKWLLTGKIPTNIQNQ
jgi:carbonic anhydrase/acetyltransferase-like protein (isoleucine patch superfamily)